MKQEATLIRAMLFASAAVAGGIIIAYDARPEGLLDSATFTFARAVTYDVYERSSVANPLRFPLPPSPSLPALQLWSRKATRPSGSLHLLFRTPFVVQARRPLKEIVDSA
jgi:hypothetical protein